MPRSAGRAAKAGKPRASGNLRIGDHWTAITIIALSQSDPLKAVAELVENGLLDRLLELTLYTEENLR